MKRHSLLLLSFFAACAPRTQGTGNSADVTIGTDGGTVTLEGLTLTFPAGAAPAGTVIKVTSSTSIAPSGVTAKTPVYRFEPDGIVFVNPVTVSFPYTGPADDIFVF